MTPRISRTVLALVIAALVAATTGCRTSTSKDSDGGIFHGLSFTSGPRVPGGTSFSVRLSQAISSASAGVGDRWHGIVTSNVAVGERVAIPAGARVTGTVAGARPAHRGTRAMLHLRVTSITTDGKTTHLAANAAPVVARSPRARNLGGIAGGAVAGALIGKAIGGDGDDAAKGAVIGGGVATGIVAASKGYQVVLGEGAVLRFTTDETVAMR